MALERLAIDADTGAHLDRLMLPDAPLADLYEENRDHPLAEMMTHPDLGRLLAVLVRATGGRAVLEIGTFVGVSATWMAQELAPGGHLDTLEVDPETADRAEQWFRRSDIADRVRVRRGDASETLSTLPDSAYDLAYVDADKASYPHYLEECVRLVRVGGLIVADNVLAGGDIGGPESADDARLAGLRRHTAIALGHPRLRSTVVTVGDGITLSTVIE